jgi:hypothetical protein
MKTRKVKRAPVKNDVALRLHEHAEKIIQKWEARLKSEILSSLKLGEPALREGMARGRGRADSLGYTMDKRSWRRYGTFTCAYATLCNGIGFRAQIKKEFRPADVRIHRSPRSAILIHQG